jgi:putative Mg2+ transporter-C (MgtC) family protein
MLIPTDVMITRLLVALFIGAVIGIEREIRNSPAGLRTISLVTLGSTLFTLASIEFAGPGVDMSRIAAQIVVGIGFLGAGVIFKLEDKVHGLTTAASLWVAAAIGLFVGIGAYTFSFVAALLVVGMLWFGKYEKKLLPHDKPYKK